MLCVMERMAAFAHLGSEISDLKSACESISRQIRGWANSLQNSDIEGQRHLNDRSRKRFESRKTSNALEEKRRRWQSELEAKLRQQVAMRATQAESEAAEQDAAQDGGP